MTQQCYLQQVSLDRVVKIVLPLKLEPKLQSQKMLKAGISYHLIGGCRELVYQTDLSIDSGGKWRALKFPPDASCDVALS